MGVNYNEVVFALTYFGLAQYAKATLTKSDLAFTFFHPHYSTSFMGRAIHPENKSGSSFR